MSQVYNCGRSTAAPAAVMSCQRHHILQRSANNTWTDFESKSNTTSTTVKTSAFRLAHVDLHESLVPCSTAWHGVTRPPWGHAVRNTSNQQLQSCGPAGGASKRVCASATSAQPRSCQCCPDWHHSPLERCDAAEPPSNPAAQVSSRKSTAPGRVQSTRRAPASPPGVPSAPGGLDGA